MSRLSTNECNGLLDGPQSNSYSSTSAIGDHEEEMTTPLEGSGYTELLSGSVPCPTCRGLGSIPKEQEGQLVALIPMKDKRLRPRRTHIWVGLAVLLCLTVAGLVMFFLFPRSVVLSSSKPYLDPVGPVTINVSEEYVNFVIVNYFNVTNSNFLPIKVTSVQMTVLYDTQVLSENSNTTEIEVHMRGNAQHYVLANVTLDSKNQMGYKAGSCQLPIRWAHEILMMFQFTCNYEVLGHSEQVTLQTFQFVSCYSTIKPSTIAPATTTKHTTNTTTTTTTKAPKLNI